MKNRQVIEKKEYSTEYVEKFIQSNYNILGWQGCANFFGFTRSKVYKIGKKYGLSLSKEAISKIRSEAKTELGRENSIDICNNFSKIETPEVAYLLGYIWADGHISKETVAMTIAEDDMRAVEEIFLSTGNWNLKHNITSNYTKKTMSRLIKCSVKLVSIFEKMGFKEKSFTSIKKVLDFIPESLWPYWLRGYFDGDGCICYRKNYLSSRVFITSTFEQDWSGLEVLFKKLNIKYKIKKLTKFHKYKNEKRISHSSIILISIKNDIFKFFNFIYGKDLKRFGLKRKYNKFIDIFSKKMQRQLKTNSFMRENVFDYWI